VTRTFLGFIPNQAPDAIVVAWLKEAGKFATEFEGAKETLRLGLSGIWNKHFGKWSANNVQATEPND
jgi:hypothetical protein